METLVATILEFCHIFHFRIELNSLTSEPFLSDIFDNIPLAWTPKIVSEPDIVGSQTYLGTKIDNS